MAASANPAAGNNNGGQEGTNNANGTASNGVSVPHNSVIVRMKAALKNNTSLSVGWTPDEQSILEELLVKYATYSKMHCYSKIAMQLKEKCVRAVVLRCRWMNKKENGKRRKDHISRKNKDKKEKVTDSMAKSTHVANRTNGLPYAQAVMSMDSDDGISYQACFGGPTGQLLEQNAQALDQISANFAAFKIQENINLFFQARNNILTILKDLNDVSEIIDQMPPLPVKLNEELVNSILQRPPSLPNKS